MDHRQHPAPGSRRTHPLRWQVAGLLVLALAYLLGGLAVLLIHSILAQRDRAKAEAMILTANKDEEDGD